jgi:uncharacterized membrane protein
MRAVPVLLALAFLVLAHVAAATGDTSWATASVACLALLLTWPLHRRGLAFFVALAIASIVVVLLHASGRSALVLLFPPVLLTAAFGLYFARSLRDGRTPLIHRIVQALHPDALAQPGVIDYARRVTQLWAVLLLALAAINALLALLAVPGGLLAAFGFDPTPKISDAQWSLFANGLNYLLIALVFIAEFAWRRHRFPQPTPYRGLPDFLMRVARLGPEFWRQT